MFNKGSEWIECDLHVHTPISIETSYGNKNNQKTWDEFVSDIKNNYESGAILGINDYNSFEGYFKLKNEYQQLFEKYQIFPVIEFRTDDYVGKNANQKLNLHIIFSNQIPEKDLKSILSAPLTKEGTKLEDIKDINSNPISITKLKTFLNENIQYYKDKYLLMLGKNEASEIDNDIKSSYMNEIHFLCSASETLDQAIKAQNDTQKYYKEFGIKYIHCSDSHILSNNSTEQTRKIGHCFTWIKGKPCFETLKQAIYSYDTRIKISKEKPTQAVNTIDKVKINLPSDAKIGDNELCFAGKPYELELNPALNCFIGGRGTGKSLLLQLLCKNNKNLLPDQEQGKNIVIKIKNWDEYIEIDGIEFEYFGQGTIESFYENKNKFQQTVRDRLYQFWETEEYTQDDLNQTSQNLFQLIKDKEAALQTVIDRINRQVELLQQKVRNNNEIKNINKEIEKRNKIITTYTDQRYKDLQTKIQEFSQKVSYIDKTKSSYNILFEEIKTLVSTKTLISIDENQNFSKYALKFNDLLKKLEILISSSGDSIWEEEINLRRLLKESEDML